MRQIDNNINLNINLNFEMKKFLTRTLSGAVYVAIIVATVYAGWIVKRFGVEFYRSEMIGSIIASAVFFAIGLIGTYEIINNLAKKGVECNRFMAYLTAILTFILIHLSYTSYYYFELTSSFWTLRFVCILPALWLSVFVVQLWRDDEHPFATAGYTLLPSLWLMLPLSIMCNIQLSQCNFLMMVFIFIWVNDSFAYLTGMLLGKHKMWERHSPNKTWEGTIGGALFCVAAALFIAPLFNHGFQSYSRASWIAVGLICSVLGTLGDLVESMFKRYCGVKDSGNIMPGHGGVLDRFDSLLIAVPFVETYLVILYS